jgi:cell division protein YceG involved in septum cleavage
VAIDKAGNSVFTNDYEQHRKNITQACRNGVPLC